MESGVVAVRSRKSAISALARVGGLVAAVIMLSGATAPGKQPASKVLLRCDVKFAPAFSSPWLLYATNRTLYINYFNNKIFDTTVNGSYDIFNIIKNDNSWIVARSYSPSLIKNYLNFDVSHHPKHAEISINKVDLSIRMDIKTESHFDENDQYGKFTHVGSEVYVGWCSIAKNKI